MPSIVDAGRTASQLEEVIGQRRSVLSAAARPWASLTSLGKTWTPGWNHDCRMAKGAARRCGHPIELHGAPCFLGLSIVAKGDRVREREQMAADFDLSGRVAIITGGNSGIGLGMAKALVRAGCTVSIWGRNPQKNRDALTQLSGMGPPVEARACDVTDRVAIEAAFAATLDAFGRVDGCFANAGIGGGGRQAFVDRTEGDWRRLFATNLDGVFHVFQVVLRHMIKRSESGDRFGRLVATSSLASVFGTARNEHYAATKAAINALTRAIAVEHARYGVTANAILPGWIKSDMTAGIMGNEKFVANVMPRIPMRRFGEPEDFGGIAVYLMSSLSSYHTADCFVIDGGYTAF
jgi:NAD(P)-dependent dehydrogenase (short-subunit alcohol dehydrogenase family)